MLSVVRVDLACLSSALTLALGLVKDDLTHTHRYGSYFDILVWANVFKCIFEAEDYGWSEGYLVIATRSAHVR